MNHCKFVDTAKGLFCPTCERKIPNTHNLRIVAQCTEPPCQRLGPPIERHGVIEKVKCGCSGELKDQRHPAYQCNAPEHQRRNEKPGQCLPTFKGPFDEDHQPESYLFKLCYGCEVNPEFQATSG